MYGYITMFPPKGIVYVLNGVGFVIRRRGASGERGEVFVDSKVSSYRYIEVLGPLVAFWGGYGQAFDQLGAYPSLWPERPSRIVALWRCMGGTLGLTLMLTSVVSSQARNTMQYNCSTSPSFQQTPVLWGLWPHFKMTFEKL